VLGAVGLGMDTAAAAEAESKADRLASNERWRRDKADRLSLELLLDERKYNREQTARKWKWEEEERDFSRQQQFINRFVGMLQQDQGLRNNFANIWGK